MNFTYDSDTGSTFTDNEWLSYDDDLYYDVDDEQWLTYITECDWLWLYGLDEILDTFYKK